ncbi:MAG: DUF6328 family protein [Desulfobacterales bacterium]
MEGLNGKDLESLENSHSDKRKERERYRELLEELRTIIPGAQVLFAFLLTVPFSSRFSGIDRLGKIIFTISIIAVAASTILFLSPAAYHRLANREDRLGRLRFGIKTTLAGLSLLAVSMTCALFVVIRFLFDSPGFSAVVAAAIAGLTLVTWYILPFVRRKRSGGKSETQI